MPAAVCTGERTLAVREVPVPEPGPGETLVEVSHCGVCGTDLHLVLEGYARPGSVLGHEWSGTVVDGADGASLRSGARVVGNPTPGCGTCRACRRGRPSVCLEREPLDFTSWRGAFTRYLAVADRSLSTVPDGLSTRHAALTEPTAIALHTVALSDVTPDDRVLVMGAGPVGLLTLAVLRAQSITDVTVVEPFESRRDRASALGARDVLDPTDLPPAPLGQPVDDPFTVAFECSGHARAAVSALDQLDYAGTLVFVGTGHDEPRVNHNRMIVLELTALGAYNYGADGFAGALELLASGRLPLDLLVEPDDVTLDELDTTMRRLARGELPGKVLVRPEARR
jgi:2-desacetyl-2-hydroxyethyl bacteriochlorophyllide A dehydrogenase